MELKVNEKRIEEIIKIAKRDNNTKRNFLLVNSLQGKHIPTSPKETFNLFEKLNKKNMALLKEKNILIIGFSETATAIATSYAVNLLKQAKKRLKLESYDLYSVKSTSNKT